MENLNKHLNGLAKEVDGILKGIPLNELDEDLQNEIREVQDVLNFSDGESMNKKVNKLKNALDAITNYKRNI